MKLLFDQNLSFKLCDELSDLFPGSSHVRLCGLANASDRAVWDYAKANGFSVVSLDADFADLAMLYGIPPKVIWLRCGNQPSDLVTRLIRERADVIRSFERGEASCLEIY